MSETRALLLTDVVDSTQLSSRLGDAEMAVLWAAHDRVARDLLPPHGGREIDKTDGMLLMFEQAADALAYAQAYHAALAGLSVPLQARAGLHVGPVILRENAPDDVARGAKPLEVDGLAKPTAARVMALARGGQTLLSADAMQALAAQQAQVSAQSHGFWKMKGVDEPMELFEVGGAFATAAPDGEKSYRVARVGERWLPLKQVPNNLPEPADAFVGRERELDEIKHLLQAARLVTLLGMGGLGKTRLSLQVAAELRAEFPDGIWFLDLAPLRDGALVLAEAAQVLAVREEPGRPLLQTLCAQLKSRRLLIVLDNCEHLLQACASFSHALLKAAPDVRLLASSREALRVPGEQAYPILPLPLPGRGDSPAQLAASTAVRLFVARAQAHKTGFELTPEQAPAIAELVTRLEGIPLALELAAARVRLLAVADINKRLGDRYKLLTGGDRVLQQRQQTLRALVDWSHELLSENEQLLFRRLGVFVGGFDLAAAEQVCAQEPLDSLDVMDLLGSLVEKSLVLMEELPEGARYRMLETLREYASDKLAASGEKDVLAAAHCQYFFGLAKQGRNGLRGPEQGKWLDRLDLEHDNLRAAHALAVRDEGIVDALIAVKLAVALQGFWILRGYVAEGRTAVAAALELPIVQATGVAHAHALYVAASLAYSQSDYVVAQSHLELCLELRRGLGLEADIAATLSTLAMAWLGSGKAEVAREAVVEALELFRRLDAPTEVAIMLLQLGQIELYLGNGVAAQEWLQSALEHARAARHPETEAEAELSLGILLAERADWPSAELSFSTCLSICTRSGDRRGAASAHWWLGRSDLAAGRLSQAAERLDQALKAFEDFEMREQLLSCLEDYAHLALAIKAKSQALELAAGVSGLREKAALRRSVNAQVRWEQLVESLKSELPADDFDARWAQLSQAGTQDMLARAKALSKP